MRTDVDVRAFYNPAWGMVELWVYTPDGQRCGVRWTDDDTELGELLGIKLATWPAGQMAPGPGVRHLRYCGCAGWGLGNAVGTRVTNFPTPGKWPEPIK